MSFIDMFQSSVIRNNIFEFLNDKEKLIFTSCNNFLYSKRTSIVFTKQYFIRKDDISYKYYNQLTKINVYELFKFPTNLKFLEFKSFFEIKIENNDIPETLLYLKLDEEIYENYKDKISKNILIELNPNSSKGDRHRKHEEYCMKRLRIFHFPFFCPCSSTYW